MRNNEIQIIRINQLCKILCVSKSTLWRMRRDGELPEPINLSNRLVGWEKSTIESWLRERSSNKK